MLSEIPLPLSRLTLDASKAGNLARLAVGIDQDPGQVVKTALAALGRKLRPWGYEDGGDVLHVHGWCHRGDAVEPAGHSSDLEAHLVPAVEGVLLHEDLETFTLRHGARIVLSGSFIPTRQVEHREFCVTHGRHPAEHDAVIREWLASRIARAGGFDDVAVNLLTRPRAIKVIRRTQGDGGNRKPIRLDRVQVSMLVMATVADAERAAASLLHGFGRHKAFGSGGLFPVGGAA